MSLPEDAFLESVVLRGVSESTQSEIRQLLTCAIRGTLVKCPVVTRLRDKRLVSREVCAEPSSPNFLAQKLAVLVRDTYDDAAARSLVSSCLYGDAAAAVRRVAEEIVWYDSISISNRILSEVARVQPRLLQPVVNAVGDIENRIGFHGDRHMLVANWACPYCRETLPMTVPQGPEFSDIVVKAFRNHDGDVVSARVHANCLLMNVATHNIEVGIAIPDALMQATGWDPVEAASFLGMKRRRVDEEGCPENGDSGSGDWDSWWSTRLRFPKDCISRFWMLRDKGVRFMVVLKYFPAQFLHSRTMTRVLAYFDDENPGVVEAARAMSEQCFAANTRMWAVCRNADVPFAVACGHRKLPPRAVSQNLERHDESINVTSNTAKEMNAVLQGQSPLSLA